MGEEANEPWKKRSWRDIASLGKTRNLKKGNGGMLRRNGLEPAGPTKPLRTIMNILETGTMCTRRTPWRCVLVKFRVPREGLNTIILKSHTDHPIGQNVKGQEDWKASQWISITLKEVRGKGARRKRAKELSHLHTAFASYICSHWEHTIPPWQEPVRDLDLRLNELSGGEITEVVPPKLRASPFG